MDKAFSVKRLAPKFSVRERHVIFSKGPIHLVDCRVRMPSGRILSRQILEHPGSVVIIPRFDKNRYLLVRQFRFAAREWIWEFPAGGLEKGETGRQAAKRELTEETGYSPRRVRKLVHFFPTPGISGEVMYLYLAEKLEPAFKEKDEDEEIEIKVLSSKKIEKMIRSGTIKDAKTILGFYYLKSRGI